MAELGVTASVISIVDFTLKETQALADVVESWQNAAPILNDLQQDVKAVKPALEAVRSCMQESNENRLPEGIRKFLAQAKPAIEGCGYACKGFANELSNLMSHSTDDDISKRDEMKMLFREKKILGFRNRLASYKGTLNIILLASMKTAIENHTQMEELQTKLEKTMDNITGQIQGLTIGAPSVVEPGDVTDEQGLSTVRETTEKQIASLGECLKTCTLALAETSATTGTTVKHAEALDSATLLFGNIGNVAGTDIKTAAVTAEKIIARDQSVMFSGNIAEDIARAALAGRLKK